MKAITYSVAGTSDVLKLVERELPAPAEGEVRVRIAVSGVNPTDWKQRAGSLAFPEVVPNQDGAGVIDAVGDGVDPDRIGERVWIWEAAWRRANGTAQEWVTVPAPQAVALPDDASFELGASIGIPALTAHRCLTVFEGSDGSLRPGSLAGRTVLVAGGAGAVGNAAIQLARWAGARVFTTVSGAEKAELARAAGADSVVNYRTADAASVIRALAPDGIDLVVEVAPNANADLNHAVLARGGTVAPYSSDDPGTVTVPAFALMALNVRYQFVLVYTVPPAAKAAAVRDVSTAVADGALLVGASAGLPLHRYSLAETGDAHDAVQNNAVGKVLITVADL